MAVTIAQNLAPIMFAALVVFLLLGYPVAFALAANGLLFFVIAVELAPIRAGHDHAILAPPPGPARARRRRDGQRGTARCPLLHFHGAGAGAARHDRGPARHDRPA